MVSCALLACGRSIVPWKRDKVTPESYWNVEGVWGRVADNPPTYQPVGYSGALSEEAGEWIVDKRDGKRFFVPKQEVRGVAPAVLWRDAMKHSGGGGG